MSDKDNLVEDYKFCYQPWHVRSTPNRGSKMTAPNFLVIGAQRAGTTFLYNILSNVADIYLPTRRKEIHFFDRYFQRGMKWYESFFPTNAQAVSYRALGEVTPDYIFDSIVPIRISECIPCCKFIVSLRNPVDRAVSGYRHHVKSFGERRSFAELVKIRHDIVLRGFYNTQLERYLDLFPRENIHVILFEDLIQRPAEILDQIRFWLGSAVPIDDLKYALNQRSNESYMPRYRRAFYAARRFGRVLTDNDLDLIVEFAKRIGIPGLFGRSRDFESSHDDREAIQELRKLYEDDRFKLEATIGRDLGIWERE